MLKLSILILAFTTCGELFSQEKKISIQERSLIIKDGLFYPDTLYLHEGESLHLMVGNFMGHSTCLVNEQSNFFVNVSPGSIVEKKVSFKNEGNFEFTCPGLKSSMTILVRPKPLLAEKAIKKVSSGPASIPDGVWVPSDNTDEGEW